MFTGIIETKGRVLAVRETNGIRRVRIAKPRGWRLAIGESIALDGICTTVVMRDARTFEIELMQETLGKTTAYLLSKGSTVNLERSLRHGARISGHYVLGHVDGVGKIRTVKTQGGSNALTVALPRELRPYVAPRGSIAINGVSLTVASRKGGTCTVAIIPHTLHATTIGSLKAGSAVNLEADIMARYAVAGRKWGGRVEAHAKKRVRKKA